MPGKAASDASMRRAMQRAFRKRALAVYEVLSGGAAGAEAHYVIRHGFVLQTPPTSSENAAFGGAPVVLAGTELRSPQRLVVEGIEIDGVVLSTVQGQGLDGSDETGYVLRRPDDTVATVLVRTGPEGRTVTVTDLPSGAELMANTPPLDDPDLEWINAPASGREML
jgi:hypothetical protein